MRTIWWPHWGQKRAVRGTSEWQAGQATTRRSWIPSGRSSPRRTRSRAVPGVISPNGEPNPASPALAPLTAAQGDVPDGGVEPAAPGTSAEATVSSCSSTPSRSIPSPARALRPCTMASGVVGTAATPASSTSARSAAGTISARKPGTPSGSTRRRPITWLTKRSGWITRTFIVPAAVSVTRPPAGSVASTGVPPQATPASGFMLTK